MILFSRFLLHQDYNAVYKSVQLRRMSKFFYQVIYLLDYEGQLCI